jgi:(p)ppGpp synthase/HD superfamily hydrolase
MDDLIKQARDFAIKAHGTQMYGEFPYSKHLDDVHTILLAYGYNDTKLLVSGFLHDAMEDTGISFNDIKKQFGSEVADIVFCLTDERGRNRQEKHEKTYPKLRSNPCSIIVKLADRIANTRHSLDTKSRMYEMYFLEYSQFRWMLYVHGHANQLWQVLDDLMNWKGY